MPLQTLRYKVTFLTPAFLGNAEQSGQWRTPPFKALLRQWWRVVWAAHHGFPCDVAAMRRDEGRLFGNAWLDGDFRKSDVRMRLSRWEIGKMKSWNGNEAESVYHPEVERTRNKVGPHAYLGYGPLDARGGTKFAGKVNAAIQAGEEATWSLAAPAGRHMSDILTSLALINAFGAAGGRSRNGWGSISLDPADGSPALESRFAPWSRPLGTALKCDWPHAIGVDDTGPLVWRTSASYGDWKRLMRDLAILKIGLRTMFVFPNAQPPHDRPQERHWLSYPITRHGTKQWDRNARLPNSLRFKVRPDPRNPKQLRGVIFHVPCRPPADFRPDDRAIARVWETTHQLLDELTHPAAQRSYAMIHDERRAKLRQSLDKLTLERSSE